MPRTSLSRPPVSRASVVRASQARRVRVACLQISLVPDAARNLAHCLRLIDEAAEDSPALMVLPEMSNWSGGMVRSLEEALQHGCTVPGPFTDALAERAERHACHIAVGLIERQGDEAFITSVILAPDRRIVLKYQKQVIFGGQRVWASSGRCGNPVVDLPFGRVGVYICADGLVPETARMLMLQGAQLLLNTLHSGGSDETHLHVPARAVENRVWVASANKVGPRDLGGVGCTEQPARTDDRAQAGQHQGPGAKVALYVFFQGSLHPGEFGRSTGHRGLLNRPLSSTEATLFWHRPPSHVVGFTSLGHACTG